MARVLVYRRRHRLTKDDEYRAVFAHKVRKSRGAITVFVRPNGLDEHRLGLSIGKRVGKANERARVKRMIREAFRHERGTIPMGPEGGGVDFVVTARAHEPVSLEVWRGWLREAAVAAVRVLERRSDREGDRADERGASRDGDGS